MLSIILATFTGRPVFGYVAMVLALVSTAFIGFGVRLHHMFTTGLPEFGTSFFTAASIMIVGADGVQALADCVAVRARFTAPAHARALLFAALDHGRVDRRDAGVLLLDAGPRYLLRGCAFP